MGRRSTGSTRGRIWGTGFRCITWRVASETGRGTMSDMNQALDWYRKAAKSDDPQARQQATDRLKTLGFNP